MADRRSQSDESLIVEYFTVQPLAACDALLNQIADQLRKRRPKKVESGNNTKPAEPTERKPSQKRKAGKEESIIVAGNADIGMLCARCGSATAVHPIHNATNMRGYHKFVPPASIPFTDGVKAQFCAKADCEAHMDANVHHRKSEPGYHEFVELDPNRTVDDIEPAGEAS